MKAADLANLYGFFSRLFVRELDEAAATMLTGPLGAELLPGFSASDEPARLEDPEAKAATFDADFVHLTVVGLVPYGSFYLRGDAMVASGTENPVADFLRRYGFEVDLGSARALSPDHIGIVLEAMSNLCAAEAEAEARPAPEYADHIRGLRAEFLREHVLSWVPVYLFAVERCAHTTLYREAARVGMDFIATDHEQLAEVSP